VVDEDLPRHAYSGELRLSESHSLPTEDHCYLRLRWKIVGGGALVRVLYLRFPAERPQPCHHFEEQVGGGLGFVLVLPQGAY
jgi:hypothetical protein